MKILSFYPIHVSWINGVAELLPKDKICLAPSGEPVSKVEQEMWMSGINPFRSNIEITSKSFDQIRQKDYDVCLLWWAVWSKAKLEERIQIPAVWQTLNYGESPPEYWEGPILYNTWGAKEGCGRPGEVYFAINSKSVLGKWNGKIPKGTSVNKRWLDFTYDMILYNGLVTQGWLEEYDGMVPFEELMKIRNNHRFYIEVNTHRYACNAVLEAMRSGMPVIAPNKPDYNRFIKDWESGILYNSPDQALLYAQQLCEDYTLAKRIGAKAEIQAETFLDDALRRKILLNAFKEAKWIPKRPTQFYERNRDPRPEIPGPAEGRKAR